MIESVKKELDGIIKKIDGNMALYVNATPNVAPDLKYSRKLSADGDWTGSFWFGMVIMAALLSGDKKYEEYLDSFYPFYKDRVETGWKDHDLGFLYQLYAVDAYRLTNDMKYADLAVRAAVALMCRYNPRGGFIRAWGRLIDPKREGKTIIDCMMNLPLLFCCSTISGRKDMFEAARSHATAALNNIRSDNSIYHTFDFDAITGKPLKGENEGGYSDESCWSRGLAWGVYGFYLAYVHTQDTKFLGTSTKLADYFVGRLDENNMPSWDFTLPLNAPQGIDTSAAAIVASALYDLARFTDKEQYYLQKADGILSSLIKNYSQVFNPESEALLDKCYCATFENGERKVQQWSSIWGDFYYMEALMKRNGCKVRLWDL
jgi:unsaturated chondroitin disaccharide hydrolase